MRIAIDASSAAIPQKTGVAKYIQRLIENAERLDDKNEYMICYRLSRRKNRRHFYQPQVQSTKVRLFQEPFFTGKGLDVFHGPDARLPKVRGPKLVATVHDLFSLVSEEFAEDKFRRKKISRYRDIATRADRIICVSESTRRDLIRFFPEAEPKTCVIYEGVDEQFCPRTEEEVERVKRKYGVRSDYILYVGELSKRKNILRMFDAFRHARDQSGEDVQFVAAGKLTYGKEEILKYIRDNRCDTQILLPGYVPEEDLPALYSGARLFLFATLYEGFGLPILEAMGCGTPVVTSNISAMPEIGGGFVSEVDPYSEAQIASAIGNILGERNPRVNRRDEQLEYVRSFTWEKTVRKTLEVHRMVSIS